MGKKAKGKSHPNKVYESYKAEGEGVKRLRRSCPKCGQGVFMAQHKDRSTCGKCGYTEFSGKEGKPEGKEENAKSESKPQAKPEAKPDKPKEEAKSEEKK